MQTKKRGRCKTAKQAERGAPNNGASSQSGRRKGRATPNTGRISSAEIPKRRHLCESAEAQPLLYKLRGRTSAFCRRPPAPIQEQRGGANSLRRPLTDTTPFPPREAFRPLSADHLPSSFAFCASYSSCEMAPASKSSLNSFSSSAVDFCATIGAACPPLLASRTFPRTNSATSRA